MIVDNISNEVKMLFYFSNKKKNVMLKIMQDINMFAASHDFRLLKNAIECPQFSSDVSETAEQAKTNTRTKCTRRHSAVYLKA